MSADPRVTAAIEYIGYARHVKVGDLPHTALMRMAAELRRQLGQVLDVVAEMEAEPEPGTCGRCGKNPVKDRTSPGINGQFCEECLDRCADSELADHVCAVDRWAEANERITGGES